MGRSLDKFWGNDAWDCGLSPADSELSQPEGNVSDWFLIFLDIPKILSKNFILFSFRTKLSTLGDIVLYSAHKTLPQLGLTNSVSVSMTTRCIGVWCIVYGRVTAAAGTRHGAIELISTVQEV